MKTKEPETIEEFMRLNRIQVMPVKTLGTYQASTDQPYRTSDREATALGALKKLANRLDLKGRGVLWHG